MDEPYFPKSEARLGKEFPNADLARLEELALPSDIVLLSRCMLAIFLQRREQFAEAGKQLQEILSASELPLMAPERSDLEVLYGSTLLATEQLASAEAEYRRALALNPKNAEAHNGLGIALGRQDKDDAAIAEFQQALMLKPELIVAYGNIGMVLAHRGQYDDAIAQYRKALEVQPKTEATLWVRFELAMSLHRKEKYDEAIGELKEVIAAIPKEAELHYNLGNIYLGKGAKSEITQGSSASSSAERDFNAAIREYDKALMLEPEPVLAAMIHINRGNILNMAGQHDKAISDFQAALLLDSGADISGIAVAHIGLGNSYEMTGRYDEATEEFRKALAIIPSDPSFHCSLANALAHQKLYDEAIAHYQEALKLNPNDAETQKNLSDVLQRKMIANQQSPSKK